MEWLEWLGQWDIILVVSSLLILCIVALFLRWFLRLNEIARTLHDIRDELRLMRHAPEREATDENKEEEKYHV